MALDGYVPVANIEVTTVTPSPNGFQLQGMGADRSDYVMEMHLDIPMDAKTRAVLAEMFSQSEWRVLRRATAPLKGKSSQRNPSNRKEVTSPEG